MQRKIAVRLLKKLLGSERYCEMFHTSYETKDNKWYCKKCNITTDKKLGDDDCGVM
jgi:hypothetical protein